MSILPVSKAPVLSEDESAALLAREIRERQPFFLVRYGDGSLECIYECGKPGFRHTCDGESYSAPLASALLEAWQLLMQGSAEGCKVYAGDWSASAFVPSTQHTRYGEEWARLVGESQPRWVHPEALLLMRESEALVDFYRAVRDDRRRKLYVGPAENAAAAQVLGAQHLVTPMRDLFSRLPWLTEELIRRNFEVLLYGAGMAGAIAAVKCWCAHPCRTYVHLGSALDPLGRGRSRMQQLPSVKAWQMFRSLIR